MRSFSRKTKGYNAQVLVAKAINVATAVTLPLFVDNETTLGRLGVYDGVDALHTNAITSAEEFRFIMRTTEGVKTTPLYKFSDVVVRKRTYIAPVKQVSAIGWNRTSGGFNNETLANGQNFLVKVIETTEGNEPYPAWNYEVTTTPADVTEGIISVARKLAKQINDPLAPQHRLNQQLVIAKVVADATYSAFAATGTTPTLTVTNGSTAVQIESGANDGAYNAVAGDYISFDAAAAPSDTVGDIYRVVSKTAGNDAVITLDRPYQGATQTFTEAEAEGTRVNKVATFVNVGLEFTTIDTNVHFRLAVAENLQYADISYVTSLTYGNGTYDQVLVIEKEGQTFYGDTTKNAKFADKYGQQDTFALSGETYDFYYIDYLKSETALAPKAEYKHRGGIMIAAAKSAGNVGSTLNTLFGV